MENRYIGLMFHIDTNRINARQKLANMNRLEEWARNDVIMLEMAEVTVKEAGAGYNSQRAAKAVGSIYSETLASTPQEKQTLETIVEILFPDGAHNNNQRNDVEIVFNAVKYCRILITADGGSRKQPRGILGSRAELKRKIGVEILTDTEAIARIEDKIHARDAMMRKRAELNRSPIPDWVDKD